MPQPSASVQWGCTQRAVTACSIAAGTGSRSKHATAAVPRCNETNDPATTALCHPFTCEHIHQFLPSRPTGAQQPFLPALLTANLSSAIAHCTSFLGCMLAIDVTRPSSRGLQAMQYFASLAAAVAAGHVHTGRSNWARAGSPVSVCLCLLNTESRAAEPGACKPSSCLPR